MLKSVSYLSHLFAILCIFSVNRELDLYKYVLLQDNADLSIPLLPLV